MANNPTNPNALTGSYTATWNTAAIGLVQGPYILRPSWIADGVFADQYGGMKIDDLYLGQDQLLLFIMKEWTASVRSILWPFATNPLEIGNLSRAVVKDNIAKQLVLTAVSGSLVDTALGFQTVTIPYSIIAPGSDIDIPMGNVERDIPIVMQCYPFIDTSDSNKIKLGTVT